MPDAQWPTRLTELLDARYGLWVAAAVRLGGEVDENWMVTTPADDRFLVKIAPRGADD